MRAPADNLRGRETKMIQVERKMVGSKKTGEGVATEVKEDMKVAKERIVTVVRGKKEPKGGTGRGTDEEVKAGTLVATKRMTKEVKRTHTLKKKTGISSGTIRNMERNKARHIRRGARRISTQVVILRKVVRRMM